MGGLALPDAPGLLAVNVKQVQEGAAERVTGGRGKKQRRGREEGE
jgi:hypothetical protein